MCNIFLGGKMAIITSKKKRRHSIINVCLRRQIHLERGPSHGKYYNKDIYELLKETNNLIEFEKQVQLLMYETFANLIEEAVK